MKNILTLLIILTSFSNLSAQKKCNCCSAKYKQFDFWLGDWEVFNKKGDKIGENKILSMQDSCVIQENWSSAVQTGTSYNFYNRAVGTWNQTYVDNTGTVLVLKGGFQNNQMILESEKIKSAKENSQYFNRITWAKDSVGNVSQKWDIVDDKGTILQVAFDGIYKRKKD
jgi:hypothetical protein